jgi:hypothetical protein
VLFIAGFVVAGFVPAKGSCSIKRDDEAAA